MGGIGSGRQFGSGGHGRLTTEGIRSIDIRYLKKKGALAPGIAGEWSWTTTLYDGSENVAKIGFRVEEDRVLLSFSRQVDGGDWEDVKQKIYLDQTACNFGGYRDWFLCPDCGERVAILYGVGKYFLCRHCHNLVYESQNENGIDRMFRKVRKIHKRLGASDNPSEPILEKPKHMHQKTFDRLVREAEEADEQAWGVLGQRFISLSAH